MSAATVNELNHPISIRKARFNSRIIGPDVASGFFDLSRYVGDRLKIADFNSDINSLSDSEITDIIGFYRDAALAARDSGIKVSYITATTGTLLGLFISPATNNRTDKWGGALTNRLRLAISVLDTTRKTLGDGPALGFRISGAEFIAGGYTVEEGIRIAEALDEKVDILHITAGIDNGKDAFIRSNPKLGILHGSNLRLAAEIKPHVKCIVATEAGLWDLRMMNDIIASKKADILYCKFPQPSC